MNGGGKNGGEGDREKSSESTKIPTFNNKVRDAITSESAEGMTQ
jgi:hypothetical protein